MLKKSAIIIVLSASLGTAGAQAPTGSPMVPSAAPSSGGSTGVSSLATACPTTGAATGAVTVTGRISINAQVGTSYAIAASDCGKIITLNNASPVAVSIPQAGTGAFTSDFYVPSIVNLGAGLVTITPVTSTINGNATQTLSRGQSIGMVSDGTNYVATQGVGGASTLVTFAGYNTTGFYSPDGWDVSGSGGVTGNANTIKCAFGPFLTRATISALNINVTTLHAGGNVQLAIYANSNGVPSGSPISSTASFSTTNTGIVAKNTQVSAVDTPVQLGPSGTNGGSDLWWCSNTDDTTAVLLPLTLLGNQISRGGGATSAANALSAAGVVGKSCAAGACNGGSSTLGTWPNLTGSTWSDITNRSMPLIAWQPTSVP